MENQAGGLKILQTSPVPILFNFKKSEIGAALVTIQKTKTRAV
jgi:hypothetical protein